MENLVEFLVENKEWLFSGILVALGAISANLMTKALITTRYLLRDIKRTREVIIKVNGIKLSLDSENADLEVLKKQLKEINGENFVDPEAPNKSSQ